jgi:hypothetical protein
MLIGVYNVLYYAIVLVKLTCVPIKLLVQLLLLSARCQKVAAARSALAFCRKPETSKQYSA